MFRSHSKSNFQNVLEPLKKIEIQSDLTSFPMYLFSHSKNKFDILFRIAGQLFWIFHSISFTNNKIGASRNWMAHPQILGDFGVLAHAGKVKSPTIHFRKHGNANYEKFQFTTSKYWTGFVCCFFATVHFHLFFFSRSFCTSANSRNLLPT